MKKSEKNEKKNEKKNDKKKAKLPYMMNRELSWLKFNERVLNEAGNPRVPLAERLSFAAIYQSNLDEFYGVRVGTLGIDFVKMIFCGFLKLMIYLPNNLPILRAYKSLETIYSKAFGQFLIVSHLQ